MVKMVYSMVFWLKTPVSWFKSKTGSQLDAKNPKNPQISVMETTLGQNQEILLFEKYFPSLKIAYLFHGSFLEHPF